MYIKHIFRFANMGPYESQHEFVKILLVQITFDFSSKFWLFIWVVLTKYRFGDFKFCEIKFIVTFGNFTITVYVRELIGYTYLASSLMTWPWPIKFKIIYI